MAHIIAIYIHVQLKKLYNNITCEYNRYIIIVTTSGKKFKIPGTIVLKQAIT